MRKAAAQTSLFLAVVVLAFSGCTPEGFRPQHTQSGASFSREVHMVSDMLLPIGIRNADHKETTCRLDYQVEQVDEQGNAVVKVTIGSLQADMKSLSVKMSFDSRNPDADEEAVDDADLSAMDAKEKRKAETMKERRVHFREVFSSLVGVSYRARVNPQGAVVELFDIDPTIKGFMNATEKGNFGRDQAWMLLAETNLRAYVADAVFDQLPENLPPASEQTWTGYRGIVVPRADVVPGKNVYQFQGMEDGVIAVTYELQVDLNDVPEDAQAVGAKVKLPRPVRGLEIIGGEGSGKIAFDVKTGRLIEHEDKTKIEIQTAGRGPADPDKPRRNRIFYVVNRTIRGVN